MIRPGLVVALAGLLLVALLSFNSVRDRDACAARAHGLGYRYSYVGGCDYRVGEDWIPDAQLRFTDDGKILQQVSRVAA